MSAEARRNGWNGFDGIGEKVDKGEFGQPPARGGWLYRCDGMPSMFGCGAEMITPVRLKRVGVKKSGWLVCYGLEPDSMDAPFSDRSRWHDDHDVVLTFCPSCRKVVEEQNASP